MLAISAQPTMSNNTRGHPEIITELQTSAQAWQLIEQDYTLRLSLVASERAEEHLKAWNAVFAEGRRRGNSAYWGDALVQMEIEDEDKRAEWSYRTCCEIWEVQGRTKSRPFFRAIFDACLLPMFAVREGCFNQQLELQQKRTGASNQEHMSAVVGHMKRERGTLRAKWNTKLEIAARDNEYQQQRIDSREPPQIGALSAPPPAHANIERLSKLVAAKGTLHSEGELLPMKQVYAAASSFSWKELEHRFRQIQTKPQLDQRVLAEFTRTAWDSGVVTEEWTLRGDSVCRTEFERFASIAARKLGYAGAEDAIKFWLERTREWLLRTGLDRDRDVAWCPSGDGHTKGKFYKTSHLNSERIAEVSAMFCTELMAQGAPESAFAPTPETPGITDSKLRVSRPRPKTIKNKSQSHKTRVVFGAIQSELKALKYCVALDERKVRIPDSWTEEGCPSTYALAYRDPKWRKRIQDEKCRFRKQYDLTPVQEREAIIQGGTDTRRTRP
jgi:hypothetical protein